MADRLRSHFGDGTVFIDVDSIPYGLDFRTYLDEQVSKCQVLLAVMGKDWLTVKDEDGRQRLQSANDFVRIEIEAALRRNIPVIPLLVQGAEMPPEKKVPESLRPLRFRNGTQIRHDPDFHRDMDRLIKNLEQHLRDAGDDTEREPVPAHLHSSGVAVTAAPRQYKVLAPAHELTRGTTEIVNTNINPITTAPLAVAHEASSAPKRDWWSSAPIWQRAVVAAYRLVGGVVLLWGVVGFLFGDVPNVKVISSGMIAVSVGLFAAAAVLVKRHPWSNVALPIAAVAAVLYFAFLTGWLGPP
jgi:hypothetical protein